jgi:hypothetical protein
MFKNSFLLKEKYFIGSLFLIIVSFFYSAYIYLYAYDGHHHGYIYSNAIDLINGRLPYKEIFIQYGILTTIIHSLIILLFGENIYYINLINIFIYSSSIFLIFLITSKIINNYYAFLATFLILTNHPIPWLPWSNYISFFFILLGLFFYIKKFKYFYLYTGISLAFACLSRQDYFIPIFITFVLFLLSFTFQKNKELKTYLKIFYCFLTVLFTFIFLLFISGLLKYWVNYFSLHSMYLESSQLTLFNYLYKYLLFFLSEALINFINYPQYFLIFFILISSSFYILFNKRYNYSIILFMSVLSVLLSAVSINLELFRLYSSVSIGVIVLLFIISKIKYLDYRKFIIFLLFIVSLFSFCFYPKGNYEPFKKIDTNITYEKNNLKMFKYQRWPKAINNYLYKYYELEKNILKNCKIEYAENLTFNNYFTNLMSLKRIKLIPYIKSDIKNTLLTTFFEENFVLNINNEILKKNILVLVEGNNDKYNFGNINFNNDYSYSEISLNDEKDKPKIIRLYYPSNCLFIS